MKLYLFSNVQLKINALEFYLLNDLCYEIFYCNYSKYIKRLLSLEKNRYWKKHLFKILNNLVTSYLQKCFRYLIFTIARLAYKQNTKKLKFNIYNSTKFESIYVKKPKYSTWIFLRYSTTKYTLLPNCLIKIYATNLILIFYEYIMFSNYFSISNCFLISKTYFAKKFLCQHEVPTIYTQTYSYSKICNDKLYCIVCLIFQFSHFITFLFISHIIPHQIVIRIKHIVNFSNG